MVRNFWISSLTLVFTVLSCCFVTTTFAQKSEILLSRIYPFAPKLLHHPPSPFLKGKPYYLELYVEIPEDSLESVTIFFKSDTSADYQEIPMEKYRGIYRFKYDPLEHQGDEISYFFVVSTKSHRLYATPLDTKWRIAPVQLNPVDPVKYYQRRKNK